ADAVVFLVHDSQTDQHIEGASVTFDGETQLTNVNGMAQWMHVLLHETYTVVIEAEGYQTYTEDIYIQDDMPHEIGLNPLQVGNIGGIVTDLQTGFPIIGATVQFGEFETVTLQQPIPGGYGFVEIPTGDYDVTVSMDGYTTLTDMCTVVEGNNQFDFSLEPEGEPGFTITYNVLAQVYVPPPFPPQDPIPVSLIPAVVTEGETFVMPEYNLDHIPGLGDGFDVYLMAIAGTEFTIPEGSLDQDIIINMTFENLAISMDDPPNLTGIVSPDDNLDRSLWSFVKYDVMDALGNPLNDGEDFNFFNDNQMNIDFTIDQDFAAMMMLFGLQYTNLEAGYWMGDAWSLEGISSDLAGDLPPHFVCDLGHLSEVGFGEEGRFGGVMVGNIGGLVYDNTTLLPIVGATVQFGDFETTTAGDPFAGIYALLDIPVGIYDVSVSAAGYDTYTGTEEIVEGTNEINFGLDQAQGEQPSTITYNIYAQVYVPPPLPPEDPILVSLLPAVVEEGEPFVIPEYDLTIIPGIGESFNVYMSAIAGTELLVPDGAIDQDIQIDVIFKNLMVELDIPMELTGIVSPDNPLDNSLWSLIEFNVFDADGEPLNNGEDFYFEDEFPLQMDFTIDESFALLMVMFGLEYTDFDASFWMGDHWTDEGIVDEMMIDLPPHWIMQTTHLSEIGFGEAGRFGAPPAANVAGMVTDFETDLPVSGVDVYFNNYNGQTNEFGLYGILDIPAGEYIVFIDADGYQLYTEDVVLAEGDNVLNFALTPGIEGQNTLNYLLYFQPFGMPEPILISEGGGEFVLEGEPFIIPDYDLTEYPMLGESFEIYMAGVSGAEITVPMGGIDEDIEIHLIIKNIVVTPDIPMEILGFYCPDPDLENQLWMYAEYQVFDMDGNWLNEGEEHFYFNDGFPMHADFTLDDDFWLALFTLNLDYDAIAVAFWDGYVNGWELDGIAYEMTFDEYPPHLVYDVAHLSDIAGGPEGGFGGNETLTLTVPVNANIYELVSTNLIFEDLNVASVFQTIDDLQIVYSHLGGFYVPGIIDVIGDINPSFGYKLFTLSEDEWIIEGLPMDPATEYSASTGTWNWIGYPFQDEVNVENALAHIAPQIEIIINDEGGFWVPAVPLNTMGNLVPGTGYQIFVNENINFQYQQMDMLATLPQSNEVVDVPNVEGAPQATGLPYIVMFDLSEELVNAGASIIEVYDNSTLVGKAAVLEDNDITPVITWQGDDEHNLSGFTAGNSMRVRVVDAAGDKLAVCMNPTDVKLGEGAYSTVGLELVEVTIPQEFIVHASYPNPFNPSVTVPFSLPNSGEVTISVFNMLGQQVASVSNHFKAGNNRYDFDVSQAGKEMVSGMYFMDVQFEGQHITQKIMLLK
ncbi:carboxypeptidase regulatory-like domain-containing protein, partial [bacterium]|nr:carboxypeptidase regulatory-like domain-containing protein [bacterium]